MYYVEPVYDIEDDFDFDEVPELNLEIYETVKRDFELCAELFQRMCSNYYEVENRWKDYMYFLEAIQYINPYRLKYLEIEEVYPEFLRFKYGPDYIEKLKAENETPDDSMEQLSIWDIIGEDGGEQNDEIK